ncbi:MAG TPA: glycoside hydrolase family 88 protein, partial [Ohtaekwangia sp.]|nr:glycoside hydrolase family 88 protein [Ohtaekwangia sp.]
AQAIAKSQDKRSGVWYQVLDQPERQGNYLESSASSMFTYFLVKATTKGYIDNTYMMNAKKGYDGILNQFIEVDKNGMVSITQVCSVAGLGGNPYRDGSFEYYINEPKRANDPKAVGPFIMTAIQFESLANAENKK